MPFTPEELVRQGRMDPDAALQFEAIMARIDTIPDIALDARVVAIEDATAVAEALATQLARLQVVLMASTDRAAFTASFDAFLDTMEGAA